MYKTIAQIRRIIAIVPQKKQNVIPPDPPLRRPPLALDVVPQEVEEREQADAQQETEVASHVAHQRVEVIGEDLGLSRGGLGGEEDKDLLDEKIRTQFHNFAIQFDPQKMVKKNKKQKKY